MSDFYDGPIKYVYIIMCKDHSTDGNVDYGRITPYAVYDDRRKADKKLVTLLNDINSSPYNVEIHYWIEEMELL